MKGAPMGRRMPDSSLCAFHSPVPAPRGEELNEVHLRVVRELHGQEEGQEEVRTCAAFTLFTNRSADSFYLEAKHDSLRTK